MLTRRLGRIAATALVLGGLAGCGPEYTPLYVHGTPEQPVLAWRTCDGAEVPDGITDLAVYPARTDFDIDRPPPALWRITAVGSAMARSVRLGRAPEGFTTVTALRQPLAQADAYVVVANYDSQRQVMGVTQFRPRQLHGGAVVFGEGQVEPRSRYEQRDDTAFGCYAEERKNPS